MEFWPWQRGYRATGSGGLGGTVSEAESGSLNRRHLCGRLRGPAFKLLHDGLLVIKHHLICCVVLLVIGGTADVRVAAPAGAVDGFAPQTLERWRDHVRHAHVDEVGAANALALYEHGRALPQEEAHAPPEGHVSVAHGLGFLRQGTDGNGRRRAWRRAARKQEHLELLGIAARDLAASLGALASAAARDRARELAHAAVGAAAAALARAAVLVVAPRIFRFEAATGSPAAPGMQLAPLGGGRRGAGRTDLERVARNWQRVGHEVLPCGAREVDAAKDAVALHARGRVNRVSKELPARQQLAAEDRLDDSTRGDAYLQVDVQAAGELRECARGELLAKLAHHVDGCQHHGVGRVRVVAVFVRQAGHGHELGEDRLDLVNVVALHDTLEHIEDGREHRER